MDLVSLPVGRINFFRMGYEENRYADDADKADERGVRLPFGMQVIFHPQMTQITQIFKAALCLAED